MMKLAYAALATVALASAPIATAANVKEYSVEVDVSAYKTNEEIVVALLEASKSVCSKQRNSEFVVKSAFSAASPAKNYRTCVKEAYQNALAQDETGTLSDVALKAGLVQK